MKEIETYAVFHLISVHTVGLFTPKSRAGRTKSRVSVIGLIIIWHWTQLHCCWLGWITCSPIVKNISQMTKRTRISSTAIIIRDIIDGSKRRYKIDLWSWTEKHVGKIHFYIFCLSYLVQPVGNVRYSPGLELNQRWKSICLVHLLHFTSIFPMVLQIYMCRFKLWTVILQTKPFVQWTVCKPRMCMYRPTSLKVGYG